MRNDRVLIPVLHVAHDAKCFFALFILVFLSTTVEQLYFITKKKQRFGCMCIK